MSINQLFSSQYPCPTTWYVPSTSSSDVPVVLQSSQSSRAVNLYIKVRSLILLSQMLRPPRKLACACGKSCTCAMHAAGSQQAVRMLRRDDQASDIR